MPVTDEQRHGAMKHGTKAYAGLDFIRAAFCPLDFKAVPLGAHARFAELRKDASLVNLEVSDPLHYPRQFPYTQNGNRRTGTQIVSAAFGLAPKDVDLLLGLYNYLKRLPELPRDGRTHFTVDFLARQLQLPATSQGDYLRIRSRLFRLSYVKYTNTAFWNKEAESYDIVNFQFFNLASMSRLTESRRPIVFEWDLTFLNLVRQGAHLAFDFDLYRSLSSAMRRFYLIANRDGWNQRDSSLFIADDFAVHQIGYDDKPALHKLRLQKLKRILSEAEALGLIRPFAAWDGYLEKLSAGPRAGELALRWSRGPRLRSREAVPADARLSLRPADDALYAQVRELRDEDHKPLEPDAYRRLLSRFGRDALQQQVAVILAQKEHRPRSFQKSEVAAFINRLQHEHPEPDWYRDLNRAERLARFDDVTPGQLSLDAYGTFFRD
jgi:hypothetical protein